MKAMSMSVELADGPVRTMDGLLGDAAQSNVAKLAQDVADLLSDWDSFLAQEEAETKRQQEEQEAAAAEGMGRKEARAAHKAEKKLKREEERGRRQKDQEERKRDMEVLKQREQKEKWLGNGRNKDSSGRRT